MDACADESMYRFEEVLFLTHLECENIKNFLRTFSRYLGNTNYNEDFIVSVAA